MAAIRSQKGDVLLIIDAINDLEFPGGEKVLPWAMKLATRLAPFRGHARAAGAPIIYANDNFGLWRSDFQQVYDHCISRGVRGRDLARRLKPSREDYFVLKPQASAFFATSLVPLLQYLDAKRLILTGIATNLCVLFTAHDAHMHRYPLVVLSDCCAAETDFDHNIALNQLAKFCGAQVCLSTEFQWTHRERKRFKIAGRERS